MKYVVRKMLWDYEKEEKWLNEMSVKGLALTDYSFCRYVFTESSINEYTYRIELLEHFPTHAESVAYIRFLEETGVECVATYMRWIYLRTKTSEASFDIYSDLESKLNHYKRIYLLYNTVMWLELVVALLNIVVWITDKNENYPSNTNLILGCLTLLLAVLFFKLASPIRRKIKRFQREKAIRE